MAPQSGAAPFPVPPCLDRQPLAVEDLAGAAAGPDEAPALSLLKIAGWLVIGFVFYALCVPLGMGVGYLIELPLWQVRS